MKEITLVASKNTSLVKQALLRKILSNCIKTLSEVSGIQSIDGSLVC
jgi:hypothetical protein